MVADQEAVKLINDLLVAESRVATQAMSRKRGATNKAVNEENRVVKKLFFALCGYKPTAEQLKEMVGV